MWTFWATFVVCGTALTLAYGARPFVARIVAAMEVRLGLAVAAVAAAPPSTPMPPDLVQHAARWADTWAREAELQAMQEAFDSYGAGVDARDRWQRVRLQFGALG